MLATTSRHPSSECSTFVGCSILTKMPFVANWSTTFHTCLAITSPVLPFFIFGLGHWRLLPVQTTEKLKGSECPENILKTYSVWIWVEHVDTSPDFRMSGLAVAGARRCQVHILALQWTKVWRVINTGVSNIISKLHNPIVIDLPGFPNPWRWHWHGLARRCFWFRICDRVHWRR